MKKLALISQNYIGNKTNKYPKFREVRKKFINYETLKANPLAYEIISPVNAKN